MGGEYTDVDFGGITLRMSEAALKGWVETGEYLNKHLQAVGALCLSYAAMDHAVDGLFEPLLQCSSEQVACMMVENLSTRRTQLVRLLYLEQELPESFLEWLTKLLDRASNELADARNRYVHDRLNFHWSPSEKSIHMVNKKPRMSKAQSRQRKTVTFDTKHPTKHEDLDRLIGRVETVSSALRVAKRNLVAWRLTGQLPPLDPQWLPACKPKALGQTGAWSADQEEPAPSHYEFD